MNRRIGSLFLVPLASLLFFVIVGAAAQGGGTKSATDFGIAVKASDGIIRTALNTCQVCYRSGRGYYKQVGDVFVYQNCGNRFKVDQVELIKGGCNPVPILNGDKTDLGDSIGISKAHLESVAPYFAVWKKRA
jgi:uncharacterized membrane protein